MVGILLEKLLQDLPGRRTVLFKEAPVTPKNSFRRARGTSQRGRSAARRADRAGRLPAGRSAPQALRWRSPVARAPRPLAAVAPRRGDQRDRSSAGLENNLRICSEERPARSFTRRSLFPFGSIWNTGFDANFNGERRLRRACAEASHLRLLHPPPPEPPQTRSGGGNPRLLDRLALVIDPTSSMTRARRRTRGRRRAGCAAGVVEDVEEQLPVVLAHRVPRPMICLNRSWIRSTRR